VATHCKLEEFVADPAAWRARISAVSRQRQLFEDAIGTALPRNSFHGNDQKLRPIKDKHKSKDEIDELFDAATTEAIPRVAVSSKKAARGHDPVPIPGNCDPSVAAVLSVLGGSAKKQKRK
jgi:hypothetical protein